MRIIKSFIYGNMLCVSAALLFYSLLVYFGFLGTSKQEIIAFFMLPYVALLPINLKVCYSKSQNYRQNRNRRRYY